MTCKWVVCVGLEVRVWAKLCEPSSRCEKGETPVSQPRDEVVKGRCLASQSLDLIQVTRGKHPIIASTFSGLASIPLLKINPKNFPDTTPNAYFVGLSFIWYHLRTEKASQRSIKCSSAFLLFTSKSSIYTSIFQPIYCLNIRLTRCW